MIEELNAFYQALIGQQEWIRKLETDHTVARYFGHIPPDGEMVSGPPKFDPPILIANDPLPIPPANMRGRYPEDHVAYIESGQFDYGRVMGLIEQHYRLMPGISILDWGCFTGRVLRHFYQDALKRSWKLYGIEANSIGIEWLRQNFPNEFFIVTGSFYPRLPFADASMDVIYGVSVFTHTKFLWDMWLTEMRRVLKPGGLCIQSVQCEYAWRFYHRNRHEDWVKAAHPPEILEQPELTEDYIFYGNHSVSQTFYKEAALKRMWGRYMSVIDFLPGRDDYFQDWIILRKDS